MTKALGQAEPVDSRGEIGGVLAALGLLMGSVWCIGSYFRNQRQHARLAAAEQARVAEQARLAQEKAEHLEAYKGMLEWLPTKYDDESLGAIRSFREASSISFGDLWEEAYEAVGRTAIAMLQSGATPAGLVAKVESIASAVGMPGDTLDQVKAHILRGVIWSFLEDKLLTEDEDAFISQVREALGVPVAAMDRERDALDQYRRLRNVTQWSLPSVDVDFKLRKGEVCHHRTLGALKEKRIARSYVREGKRIKEEELVAVREGEIYFTSERILVVGGGTTHIPNDKILALEMDWEAGVIEVVKDGRKSPLYVVTSDPIYSGHLISMIREAA